jgi:hypothetical protein
MVSFSWNLNDCLFCYLQQIPMNLTGKSTIFFIPSKKDIFKLFNYMILKTLGFAEGDIRKFP